jgi:hypothetical protein
MSWESPAAGLSPLKGTSEEGTPMDIRLGFPAMADWSSPVFRGEVWA